MRLRRPRPHGPPRGARDAGRLRLVGAILWTEGHHCGRCPRGASWRSSPTATSAPT